jgi:hypothetical protein
MSYQKTAFSVFTRGLVATLFVGSLLSMAALANAGDLERRQAKRIHDRIAGVPPSNTVLDAMEAAIGSTPSDPIGAANMAMANSAFYNVTLKNLAAPWTNRDQTVFVPLNDYTATVIGMVRDNVPFNQLLSADIIYTGNPSLPITGYSTTSNAHYQELEDGGYDLMNALVPGVQSTVTGLPSTATAGVMTTRGAAEAFFVAGTNRAMFRFTLLNHLCNDLEQVKDTSRAADRIRQDISRSPGGDSRIFLNSCVGCHSGMDPMAQAFAYYNFNENAGSIEYTGGLTPPTTGVVQPKYTINSDNFKYGFVTPDDSWDNYWRAGQNSLLGWDPGRTGSGSGAKSLGEELANSRAFASCQVKKVFKTVCLREPGNAADRSEVDTITDNFIASSYNMKTVFAETAVYCMGN